MSSLSPIFIIARLTLREVVRRRLLWSLAGLTVIIVVLTWWGFGRIADASPVTGPIEMIAGHSDAGLHVCLRPGHDRRVCRLAGHRARHRKWAAAGHAGPTDSPERKYLCRWNSED